MNTLYELLDETIGRIKQGCSTLAEWASQHLLTENCSNLQEPYTRDIHATLSVLKHDVTHLLNYIETLIEDVADEAEEAGVDTKPLETLRRRIRDFRINEPDDIEKLVSYVLEKLGTVMGAVKARTEA